MSQKQDEKRYEAPPVEEVAPAADAEAPETTEAGEAGADTEADILRAELTRLQEENEGLKRDLAESHDRYLRARAEQDTMRRRMLGEVELAHAEGVASALEPAMRVFDDLERALDAADKADDPSTIVPGVIAVKEGLLRALDALDVRLVGRPGEAFDPNLHEALTTVPLREGATPGTIDQVFEAGFVQGDRLVRVARVTVYADEDAG